MLKITCRRTPESVRITLEGRLSGPWVAELEQVKARLEAHGVEVVGVTDHHIFKSIYFFDPNGVRIELSAQLASEMQMQEKSRELTAEMQRVAREDAQLLRDLVRLDELRQLQARSEAQRASGD